MNRKISLPLLLIWLVSLILVTPVMAEKAYYAERFDVLIMVQEDGSALVTETVEFHFSGDPFTFAFREVSAVETDGITFLEAGMDGSPLELGDKPGQVEVNPGDPMRVTWHFAPTAPEATHVFTLRYRAEGVVRAGEADTLIWRAVPEEHDYRIANSAITLTFPAQAKPLETFSLDRNFEATRDGQQVILTTRELGEDESLVLTARFEPGSLTTITPRWQTNRDQSRAAVTKALPFGLISALGVLLLGGFGLFTYSRTQDRELNIPASVSTANPPADVPPAVIGKLTGQQSYQLGALFDLAQRGVLEIEEAKGFLGSRKYLLVRKETGFPLQPHEQGLLEAIFKKNEREINLSEVGTRLASKKNLIDEPLEEELVQRGWLDPERKQVRNRMMTLGVMGLLMTGGLLCAGLLLGVTTFSVAPVWLPWFAITGGAVTGLFLLCVIVVSYGASYSILTPAGEEQSAHWKGFGEYLRSASKGREPAIRPDFFERYLPYAAAFGVGVGWAKYHEKLGGVPLPAWFHGMAGSDGNFGSVVAAMSATDSSFSSGGAGGGAGASGGGASGAG